MPGLGPGIHVLLTSVSEDVDGRDKPGHDVETPRCLFDSVYVRHLPQAIPAQAIAALNRHRQPRGFLGAPARPCRAAGEFRSATGTSEAARNRIF
jgi:hypothetical protein